MIHVVACKYNDCMLNFLINLQDVLRHGRKRETVMKNTIKRLPVTLAIPFLKEVCCVHDTNTSTCLDLIFVDHSHVFIFVPACVQNGSYSLEVRASTVAVL